MFAGTEPLQASAIDRAGSPEVMRGPAESPIASRDHLKYQSAMARFGAIALALAFGWTLAPWAQATESGRAEAAFQTGRAHLAAGRYTEACKAFDESQREEPASGTLLALAYCQELSGLLASAWGNYRAAAELAQREGHEERRGAATEQSKVLADRLSVLTVVVPPALAGADGLRVTLDGRELARSSFGSPLPVDGGTYRVEATAGEASFGATVSVRGERDKQVVVVELTVPVGAAPAPRAPATTHERRVSLPPTPKREAHPPKSVVPPLALGAVIAGGVGLGLGAGFGLAAVSKNRASYRDRHCDARGCDARGIELRNDAFTAARVSTWSFVSGGALAIAGGAFYLGHVVGKPSALRVEATVGGDGARLQVTEAF